MNFGMHVHYVASYGAILNFYEIPPRAGPRPTLDINPDRRGMLDRGKRYPLTLRQQGKAKVALCYKRNNISSPKTDE